MSSQFRKLHERHEMLSRLHSNAVMAFSVVKALQKLKAPNIVGKDEAVGNLSAMNRYKGAFTPFEAMAGYMLYMTLARIFVSHKDALYLRRLVDYAEQNKKHLTAQDFREFQEDREYIDELSIAYKGFDREDLIHIKALFLEIEPIIEKLKVIRDKRLAHIDLQSTSETAISHADTKKLLRLSEEVLNMLTQRHFHSMAAYDAIERQTIGDVMGLIHLARFETENNTAVAELMEELGADYNTNIDAAS